MDGGPQLADVEWFWEHDVHVHALVIGANVRRKVRRQDHDLAGDAAFSQFADQFDTGHVRHFFIDNDDIVSLRTGIESGEGSIAVFNGADFVARPGKDVAQGKCDRWLVVHGQDSEG
jgi:hypothetical protein